MIADTFPRILTSIGTLTARPWAFLIVLAYAVAWYFLDNASFDVHGITTLIVWLMTLLIQRAEHRDTQAMHAKLDELLKVQGNGSENLASIDDKEAEAIEAQRNRENKSPKVDG